MADLGPLRLLQLVLIRERGGHFFYQSARFSLVVQLTMAADTGRGRDGREKRSGGGLAALPSRVPHTYTARSVSSGQERV